MGTWTTRARAAFLDAAEVSADKLAGYDAVIAKATTGENYNPLFAGKHVQAAYDAGKPCLAWLESDPNVYAGLNPGAWAAAKDDWHCKALDRSLYVGGTYGGSMRAVHGIVIDVSRNTLPNGTVLTGTWVASIAQHLMDMVYQRYKLPVYLYANKALYTHYADDPIGRESIEQVITRYGICFPGSAKIVNGYPEDAASPWKYIPFAGAGVEWYFWGYGVVNGLYSFVYNGDKAALWKELGYKATNPEPEPTPDPDPDPDPTPDPEPEPEPTPADGTLGDILAELRKLNAHLGVK